jgi:hypothetical protein
MSGTTTQKISRAGCRVIVVWNYRPTRYFPTPTTMAMSRPDVPARTNARVDKLPCHNLPARWSRDE